MNKRGRIGDIACSTDFSHLMMAAIENQHPSARCNARLWRGRHFIGRKEIRYHKARSLDFAFPGALPFSSGHEERSDGDFGLCPQLPGRCVTGACYQGWNRHHQLPNLRCSLAPLFHLDDLPRIPCLSRFPRLSRSSCAHTLSSSMGQHNRIRE